MDAADDFTGTRPLSFIADGVRDRAAELARAGRHREAAQELALLASLSPRDLRTWLQLAFARTRAGQGSAAAEAYLHAAGIYAKRGQGRRALILIRRALELDAGCGTPARLDPLVVALGSTVAPL